MWPAHGQKLESGEPYMERMTMRNECTEGEKLKILHGWWIGKTVRTHLAD